VSQNAQAYQWVDDSNPRLEGGCRCGTTRVNLRDKPLFVHACHCLTCQKNTGSAFGITTIMLESDIELIQGSLIVKAIEQAPHRHRHLCSTCGEQLYSTATNHPRSAIFQVGSLDDPRRITINAHIFTKQKHDWLVLPDNVLQFPELYDRQTTWPEESLKRLAAAIKADS
tara:strand:+ start:3132 stop:3641 length:510 start_codon:yes stop_codon:yes gene_type:complete